MRCCRCPCCCWMIACEVCVPRQPRAQHRVHCRPQLTLCGTIHTTHAVMRSTDIWYINSSRDFKQSNQYFKNFKQRSCLIVHTTIKTRWALFVKQADARTLITISMWYFAFYQIKLIQTPIIEKFRITWWSTTCTMNFSNSDQGDFFIFKSCTITISSFGTKLSHEHHNLIFHSCNQMAKTNINNEYKTGGENGCKKSKHHTQTQHTQNKLYTVTHYKAAFSLWQFIRYLYDWNSRAVGQEGDFWHKVPGIEYGNQEENMTHNVCP